MKDGDRVVQLNFPPDVGAIVVAAAPVGQTVKATGIAETQAGDPAPVFRMVSLTGGNEQDDFTGRGGFRADADACGGDGEAVELHAAWGSGRRDSGQWKFRGGATPIRERSAMLKLAVGEKISAEGRGHAMVIGHSVIGADKVNDQTIERPRRGPEDRGGPGGQWVDRVMGLVVVVKEVKMEDHRAVHRHQEVMEMVRPRLLRCRDNEVFSGIWGRYFGARRGHRRWPRRHRRKFREFFSADDWEVFGDGQFKIHRLVRARVNEFQYDRGKHEARGSCRHFHTLYHRQSALRVRSGAREFDAFCRSAMSREEQRGLAPGQWFDSPSVPDHRRRGVVVRTRTIG